MGENVGTYVGEYVGANVGIKVGTNEGVYVGAKEGIVVGLKVPEPVLSIGSGVGEAVFELLKTPSSQIYVTLSIVVTPVVRKP